MTFHYPTSDIVNTTVGQSAMTIAAGDSVLIASDIHVIDTNADSTAIDGSDASGARITVQGTVAAESYGILLAFGGSPNDINLVTVAEGGHVEAYSPIYTSGDGNVVNVFGDVVGSAFGVSQTGDATSVNQIRVSGSVVSAGTAPDLTNGAQHVTNTGLIQGGYSAGLASDFQTLHLNNAGTGFNDILTGSATANTIWGGHGDDQIAGGNGNDVLRGGDGFDILTGGAGRDILIGGAGIDHFRFTAMGDLGRAAGTRDVIRDFQTGVDKIDLSQIDPIAGGADDAFIFRAGNAFTGTGFAEVRVVASGNDMTVQLDADGNGVFDAAFTINGNGMPLVTDFFL